MRLVQQPSLLGGTAEGAEPGLGCLSPARTALTRGAWIDLHREWVHRADDVLDQLVSDVPWRADSRQMYDRVVDVPRLLAWYDGETAMPHNILALARTALSEHYRDDLADGFASAGLCLYRNGRDSVAWHGDRGGRASDRDTLVAIVSFGCPRILALRPRGGGGQTLRFSLGHGDLLVMGGSCQRTWEHAVPKTSKDVGLRVSVQFRPAGVF